MWRVTAWIVAHYEAVRGVHLMAVIAWMAGLMYLPRLYVYHSSAAPGGELDTTLKIMERRLYKGIMNPASVAVWVLGVALIAGRGGWDALTYPWLVWKLLFVSAITVLHVVYGQWLKAFAAGARPLNHIVFRVVNEAPFVLMIAAVLMVVLEPG
jgi:protoporphyrinogen IX oxidase